MGIRQAGQRFIFFRERSEVADDRDQLGADDAERVADEDHIRIVGDITACRAEMDDPRSLGTDFPIGTNMRHHIVAGLLFDLGHAGKVDIRNLLTHLRKLRVGDGQSQLPARSQPAQSRADARFHSGSERKKYAAFQPTHSPPLSTLS